MKKFVLFLSKKYLILAGAFLVVGAFVWYIQTTNSGLPEGVEVGLVTQGEVIEIVNETGSVEVARSVDLAFERGGRVTDIPFAEGDVIAEGDVLVTLNTSEQRSGLIGAQARLEAEQVRLQELINGADTTSLAVTQSSVTSAETTLENAKRNLTEVTEQQNQIVKNAERILRSSTVQAYLVSDERESPAYSFVAPTVTGTYTSVIEGLYTLALYNSDAPSGASFVLSGLETDTQSVSAVNPVAVGTRGLYVQFPENFAKRTIWEIPIPNTRSSSYLTNLNAYNAVVDSKNLAIATAENTVKTAESALVQAKSQLTQVSSSARNERILAQQALVRQMEALVVQAQVAYENTIITAPFSGVITMITTEVGQVVSPNVTIVSLITQNNYEVSVDISEVDIAEVSVDDTATVSFDAYNDLKFTAKVSRVAPNARLVSGVRVFTVTLVFDTKDERIKDGLTVEVDITTAIRQGVIAIPTRAIYENEQGKFVRTISDDGQIFEVGVTTGLRGSNGMTEIVGGLSEGIQIITFANEEAVAKIKNK